jgi:hypothetical protein
MKSYLAKHQPRSVWDAETIRDRAREAWREHGVLLVRIEDVPNDWERQFMTGIGERLYGKRKG